MLFLNDHAGRKNGAVALVLFLAVFYAFFWNRSFAPNVEGWFEYYAVRMNDGQVPYRDFYLFTTPLFPLVLQGLFSIFDRPFMVSHLMGVVVNIGSALCMYGIAMQLSLPPFQSMVAVACATLVFSLDTGEPTNYYNHLAVFFASLSAWLYGRAGDGLRRGTLIAAGAAAMGSFLSKQTIGLFWSAALVGLPVLEAIWQSPGTRRGEAGRLARVALGRMGLVGSGMVLACLPFVLWLSSHGALYDCLDQTLIRGPSSKGAFLDILTRPFLVPLRDASMKIPLAAGALISVLIHALAFHRRLLAHESVWYGAALAAFFCCVKAGFGFEADTDRFLFRTMMYAGVVSAGLLLLEFMLQAVVRAMAEWNADEEHRRVTFPTPFLPAACLALAVWVTLGMSYPIYEPMALSTIPLPFFLLLWLARADAPAVTAPASASVGAGRVMAVVALCLATWVASTFKLLHPWSWSGWIEPPLSRSTEQSSLAGLQGLRLPPTTINVLDSTVEAIQAHSQADDDVYAYPYFPSLYMLAGKKAYTFSYVHFIDVAPDYVVARDIETLKSRPPRVLVKLDHDRAWIEGLSHGFRRSGESEQTRLFDFLNELARDYSVVHERIVMPNVWLRVYVRRTTPSGQAGAP
jgi:hypothetical protein